MIWWQKKWERKRKKEKRNVWEEANWKAQANIDGRQECKEWKHEQVGKEWKQVSVEWSGREGRRKGRDECFKMIGQDEPVDDEPSSVKDNRIKANWIEVHK